MKKGFAAIVCLMVLFSIEIKAQGEAALPMLELNPDPQSIALGWGGAANVSSAPSGYYYNPALLGYYAQNTNLSFQTYAAVPVWLNLPGLKLYNKVVTLGYNYKTPIKNFNVSLGLAYMNAKFDYGTFAITGPDGPDIIGTFLSYDKYDAYSFGISFDYFINLSFGMNFKKVKSVLSERPTSEESSYGKVDVKAMDWGLLLDVPVLKLIDSNFKIDQGELHLKPFVDFSFGLSRTNIGNEIYYIDPAQADPLPLTAHMGYNLSLGTNIKAFDTDIQLFRANFMIDAQDMLINNDSLGFSYQPGFGDIKFTENLIKWKPTDKTLIRKGSSITFFETVTLMAGSFFGVGYPGGMHTKGIAVSSDGLFKILSTSTSNYYIGLLARHLEIKYVNATTFVNNGFNTTLEGLSLSVKNISL